MNISQKECFQYKFNLNLKLSKANDISQDIYLISFYHYLNLIQY